MGVSTTPEAFIPARRPVGKTQEGLGLFIIRYKKVELIEQWEERDVTTIAECRPAICS